MMPYMYMVILAPQKKLMRWLVAHVSAKKNTLCIGDPIKKRTLYGGLVNKAFCIGHSGEGVQQNTP